MFLSVSGWSLADDSCTRYQSGYKIWPVQAMYLLLLEVLASPAPGFYLTQKAPLLFLFYFHTHQNHQLDPSNSYPFPSSVHSGNLFCLPRETLTFPHIPCLVPGLSRSVDYSIHYIFFILQVLSSYVWVYTIFFFLDLSYLIWVELFSSSIHFPSDFMVLLSLTTE